MVALATAREKEGVQPIDREDGVKAAAVDEVAAMTAVATAQVQISFMRNS